MRSAVSSARVGPVTVASTSPRADPRRRRATEHARRGRAGAGAASKTAAATASPATTPSARATRSAVSVCSAGMVASLVTSTPSGAEVLVERGRRRSARTAAGSSPAAPQRRPRGRRRLIAVGSQVSVELRRRGRCAASRWPRHSSPASGKSSRQWQPRVSSPGRAAADQRARPRSAGWSPPSSRSAGRRAVAPSSASVAGGRRPATSALRSTPAPAGHRPLQRRRGPPGRRDPAPRAGAAAPARPARAGPAAMSSAIRRANTSPSSSELRGQPVGAVHAGAGDLAAGVQARDRGAAVQVGAHAAGGVVRGRRDRDQVGRRVDAGRPAGRRRSSGTAARATSRPRCRASR